MASFKTNNFDQGRVIKIAIKSIWTSKGAFVTSFKATGENHRRPFVAMLCAIGDAQCKTRELLVDTWEHEYHNTLLHGYIESLP